MCVCAPATPPTATMPTMDQRELDTYVKQLTKCISANEAPENALRLLETLKKDASPTEEMLRATRAGVFVGKLRTNSNKEIARAASELVAKWKKLVEHEKKHKSHKLNSPAPGSAPSSSPNARTTPVPAPAAAKGTSAKFTGNAETRKFESDGVDTQRTDSQVRNSCIGLIYNGLAYRSVESPSDVIARAVSVEQAAFSRFRGESNDYKKKIRSLFSNLKDRSNRELGLRVMSGTISADKFVGMSDEELKSESLRKLDREAEEENIKNAQVAKGEKSYSDSLECGRCKKKMVSYTQAQTRSADEPMTTFCECMNCGKRWKFS